MSETQGWIVIGLLVHGWDRNERAAEGTYGRRNNSDEEYRQAVADGGPHQIGLFALVPQLRVDQVGDIDLAIFVPGISKRYPVVAVETDGHAFHERTPDQASNDRRRDRILQRCRIPVFRFTGADVVRASEESAYEIVDYIDEPAKLSSWRRTH